ncbi:MAG: 50S ribosomal protein L3 N(5)-glutamine methyltransferase [Burkholderiaceae bacterium]|jgi:ribosomal protein L3 glutamine methyltransferase
MHTDIPLTGIWQEAAERLVTVADWLRFSVSCMEEANVFFGHGSDNAHDEAVYLVQKALKLSVEHIEPYLNARLLPSEAHKLAAWLRRRVDDRMPTAYLAHEAWLQGQPFFIDERALVPRSFIAELLAEGLSPWVIDPDKVGSILDLCTGSACLAILAAQAFPQASIDAVDLSADALAVAEINIRTYRLSDRVRPICADLFDSPDLGTYDLIMCNPPYVNHASMERLPAEYRNEPALALDGGADGMDIIRRVLQGAKRLLNTDGFLIVELGNEQAHFLAAFPDLKVIWLSVSAGDNQVFLIERSALP